MAIMRSPNYPAVGLKEAVDLCRKVWEKEKRSFVPQTVVVQAWGYSGLSGASRIKLAALKRYDLLEESESGDVRLSATAMDILHHPDGSLDQLAALRHAGLSPDLFRELQQTYPVASIETIRSYLLTKKGFSEVGANSCIEAFRDTQKIARLGEAADAESVTMPQASELASSVMPSPAPQARAQTAQSSQQYLRAPIGGAGMTFRWPLPRGVVAELTITGDVLPAHLTLIKQYLDVAKAAIEMDLDTTEGDGPGER
jgi:hypothetical protein